MNPALLFPAIAPRNLRRNLRRSLITVIAIAFGLFCLILFEALKVGLHREMMASTIELDTGSLQIRAAGNRASVPDVRTVPDLPGVLKTLEGEGLRAAPRLKSPALQKLPGLCWIGSPDGCLVYQHSRGMFA